jgi:hypothetical protein
LCSLPKFLPKKMEKISILAALNPQFSNIAHMWVTNRGTHFSSVGSNFSLVFHKLDARESQPNCLYTSPGSWNILWRQYFSCILQPLRNSIAQDGLMRDTPSLWHEINGFFGIPTDPINHDFLEDFTCMEELYCSTVGVWWNCNANLFNSR